jgi:hypothetical protein
LTLRNEKLTSLSPAQRELLELRLRKRRAELTDHVARRQVSVDAPLSFAQQRLWFLHQLQPDSPFYNVHNTALLRGELNVAALEKSFNEIARRHEILRTTFQMAAGEPRQVIAPHADRRLAVEDFNQPLETERDAALTQALAPEARRPFDLARGPLWRVRLLRLSPHEHALTLVTHHIILDGWSLGVLLRELTACYEAFAAGRQPALPALPAQYADFTVWHRKWLAGERLERQLAYWRKRLAGRPPRLRFKSAKTASPASCFRGARITFSIPEALTRELKRLSRRRDATLYMTLLAAFKLLLWRETGETDLWVGAPVANRPRAELEPLIGFFVNLLIMRTRLDGDPSFAELLRRVRQTALAAYEHQHAPYEKIVEELQPERGLNGSPLAQTLFVLQNAPLGPLRLAGLDWTMMEVNEGTTTFDLLLVAAESGGQLHFTCKYNSDLFDAGAIAELARQMVELLREIVSRPEAAISAFDNSGSPSPMQTRTRSEIARSRLIATKPKPVSLSPETLAPTGFP